MNDYDYSMEPWNGEWKISLPTYAWKCELCKNTFWYVEEGKQPNAFHRFMQRLCFGIKWERIKK